MSEFNGEPTNEQKKAVAQAWLDQMTAEFREEFMKQYGILDSAGRAKAREHLRRAVDDPVDFMDLPDDFILLLINAGTLHVTGLITDAKFQGIE